MPKKPQIFISYSREDKGVARYIQKFLETEGLPVWFDDRELQPGDAWLDEIEQSLRNAELFVVLFTPKFMASNWCQFEMGAALGKWGRSPVSSRHIVPIMLEGIGKDELPPGIRRLSFINAEDLDFSELTEKLRERIKEFVGTFPGSRPQSEAPNNSMDRSGGSAAS